MDAEQLYQSRKQDWQKLTDLIGRFQGNPSRLSPDEVNLLGLLYKGATSDLALAQRDFPRHKVTAYLNQLVAGAHATVYRQEPLGWKRIRRFILRGLPQAYRQTLPFTLAAAGFFLIPAVFAGLMIRTQPSMSRWLLPPEMQSLEQSVEDEGLWTEIPTAERPYTASFIMQNNIRVSFLAFGSGVLAGVFTVYILVLNGLMLGGVTGVTANHGLGFDLWTFVIGHGMIELSVIMIVGGAGLMLGWAVIRPGYMRRMDALAKTAKLSVRLLIGLVPFLVIAGLIEGFISPNEDILPLIKWIIGISTGLAMHGYLLFSGRDTKPQTPTTL